MSLILFGNMHVFYWAVKYKKRKEKPLCFYAFARNYVCDFLLIASFIIFFLLKNC